MLRETQIDILWPLHRDGLSRTDPLAPTIFCITRLPRLIQGSER